MKIAQTTKGMPNTVKISAGHAKIRDIPGSKNYARKLAMLVKVTYS